MCSFSWRFSHHTGYGTAGASKKRTVNGSGFGVDALLTTHGKGLKSGEEIRFVLVKGPSSTRKLTRDPTHPKAPMEAFPLVAKFSESVVSPDFSKAPWDTGRLYQREVPKAEDDSDDEAAAAAKQGAQGQQPRKRWRARKQKEARWEWVLQEKEEFIQDVKKARQEATGRGGTVARSETSSIYEGMPERNESQFIVLEANTLRDNNIQVTVLPTPHATIAFNQPKAVKTLSMSEAEAAIDDQRNKTSRFMMHDQKRIFEGQAPTHQSRSRLLDKLMASKDDDNDVDVKAGKKSTGVKRKRLLYGKDDDEDDVMSDLGFRNRSSRGSAKARQELLSSFGDGMRVDADGVLGGANDSMFGQRGQKFGTFAVGKDGTDPNASAGDGSGKPAGNDGNAMADDFYQRDVAAEYEELDYDANEQFDDDDVNVGETSGVTGDSNFAGFEEDEDDEMEDEVEGDRSTGAEGLASLAGLNLLNKKTRGDITAEQLAELVDKNKWQAEEEDKRLAESDRKKADRDSGNDHLAKIMEGAEKARLEAESKAAAAGGAAGGSSDRSAEHGAVGESKQPKIKTMKQVDENGQRIITLEAIQHEIWLTGGRIPMKRLTKIFDVKKKSSQDRQDKFKKIVIELCTIVQDPTGGKSLVLKQHYTRAN
eukprot:jgi/Psemu1/321047/estExt_fgenesh1_pm.C_11460001